jgi:predicted nuclease with TOPRIM domain
VPNDVIPMSDGSLPHRSIFTPIEIVQLDRRVIRLEVVTESISARLDEQKVEFRGSRAERNAQFDKVDDRFWMLDEKIEKLDARVNDRFEKLEAKLDAKFDRVDAKFDRVDARFDEVRIHARSDFHLLFGSLIASALGLAGMMVKGFGWF